MIYQRRTFESCLKFHFRLAKNLTAIPIVVLDLRHQRRRRPTTPQSWLCVSRGDSHQIKLAVARVRYDRPNSRGGRVGSGTKAPQDAIAAWRLRRPVRGQL